ncbi:MAG TPA: thioredoxin family protein [Chitinophagaceae bacterium]|nr:thioredoxin family protein [Chitinophagaceae bacterium]
MKNILFVAVFLGLVIYVIAANLPATVSGEGIHFYEGLFSEVLKKAKEENKLVFVDVSASWCGYCKKLKRNAFSDKQVGSYFNEHFINIDIDGEKGEGAAIAQQYNVQGYPTLFVIDKDGKVILYSSGYMGTHDLMKFGETAFKKISDSSK